MNTTNDMITNAVIGVPIVSELWSFVLATRSELFLFCAAVFVYLFLFGDARPKKIRKGSAAKTKQKQIRVENKFDDEGEVTTQSKTINQIENEFTSAFNNGDHRQVLRCWAAMKKSDTPPKVSLAQVVESMQRLQRDVPFVIRELQAFYKKFPGECSSIDTLNDLLENVARRLDSELAEQIVTLMGSLDLSPDKRTYEILLGMYFTTRNFSEVEALVSKMAANQTPLTTKATIVIIKTALKTNNLQLALLHFRRLKCLWTAQSGVVGETVASTTPSAAPRHIISQLVDLACKEHQLREFMPLLRDVPMTEEVIITMLSECARQKDSSLTQQVESLARVQEIPFSSASYSLLVKSFADEPSKIDELFSEVAAKGSEVASDFALALLEFCSRSNSISLANRVFEYMKPTQPAVLSAFIRFYAETEDFEKACDIYEKHDGQPLYLDGRMERSLMNAAMRCGRHALAKTFLDTNPSDIAKHITMIRNCAASGNLEGAKQIFGTLQQSGVELNSVVYNTVLDACVECGDLRSAEDWMRQIQEAGLADVVSYNTLIKAHLHKDNFSTARKLIEEMQGQGVQPNRVTYNELVNGMISKGVRKSEIWSVISEMRKADLKPNQVTCSILLKSLTARSSRTEVEETMDLISSMEEPMDEVLLSSVVEACVRVGQPDLLASKLKQLNATDGISISGSHTFGSLIKAYGHSKDVDGVWRCWKEMRSRHIRPTSVTLGCMVEAVVSNGDAEGAYELIHEIQADERCRDALNSVIYCSVLKGFARDKKLQRVWSVYEEMVQRDVDLSVVTYNTLMDACARGSRMDRAPEVLEDMKQRKIKPNLITYSTMLKGHCQAGDIQRAFKILGEMRAETQLKPDEIMYNSMLDGCAQNNMVEEGLQLLEEMQAEGVAPSNFTLSLVVKLMNRARKLDKAFTMVEDICRNYNFRPNVHVYTNLIQACIANRHLPRGMATFEKMLAERIVPESRTYSILVRASLSQSRFEQAAALLRQALGLPPAAGGQVQRTAECHNLDHALVSETLLAFATKGAQEYAQSLLADLREFKPRVRVDAAVQRELLLGASSPGAAPQPAARPPACNGGRYSEGGRRPRGGNERR